MKAWPALSAERPWPDRIAVEQGVWGKVHRQASDFRWIAASPGLDLDGLGAALGVGAEDQPTRCLFWRRLDDGRAAAIAAYPSRAVDAAGRSSFLERRIFLWRPGSGASIVRGLLALLPAVESFAVDHCLARAPGDWMQPDFRLSLEALEFEVSAPELARRAEQGRQRLTEALGEPALVAVYARLLSGQFPVVLPSPKPFGAEALAALLLPLPAEKAGALSIAGWIPSSRASASSLAENWQLVVGQVAVSKTEPEPEDLETARRWASALIEDEPRRLESAPSPAASGMDPLEELTYEPEEAVGLENTVRPDPVGSAMLAEPENFTFEDRFETPAEPAQPAWLRPIRAFAQNPTSRWLDPEATARQLPLDDEAGSEIAVWRRDVERSMPKEADAWQWAVKVDLLAALLVAVAPVSPEAGRLIFESGRVPALLFVTHLEPEQLEAWQRRCPADRFTSWRRQSVDVQSMLRTVSQIG